MINNIEQKNATVEISWYSPDPIVTGVASVNWFQIERKLNFDGNWEDIGYCPDISLDPQWAAATLFPVGLNVFWDILPNSNVSNKTVDYRLRMIQFASGDPSSFEVLATLPWESSGIKLGDVTIPSNPFMSHPKRPPIGFTSRFGIATNLSARGTEGGGDRISLHAMHGFSSYSDMYTEMIGDELGMGLVNTIYDIGRVWGTRHETAGGGGADLTAGAKTTNPGHILVSLSYPWEWNRDGLYNGYGGTGFLDDYIFATRNLIENSGESLSCYLGGLTFRSNQTKEAIFSWANLGPSLAAGQMMGFDSLGIQKPREQFTNFNNPMVTMMNVAQQSGWPIFAEPAFFATGNGWFDYPNLHNWSTDFWSNFHFNVIEAYPEKLFVITLIDGELATSQLPNNGVGMTPNEQTIYRASTIFETYPDNVIVQIGLHPIGEQIGQSIMQQLESSGTFKPGTPLRPAYDVSYSNGTLSWSEGSGYTSRDLYFVKTSSENLILSSGDNVLIEDYSDMSITDDILKSYLDNGTYNFEVWTRGPAGSVRNQMSQITFSNTARLNESTTKINNLISFNNVSSTAKGGGLGSNLNKISNNLNSDVNFKVKDTESPKGRVLNLKTNEYIYLTDKTDISYNTDRSLSQDNPVYREPTSVSTSGF